MKLTDFLLARITEDEARAKAVDAEDWYGVDAWGDGPTEFYFDDGAPGTPARVLAECEAKRQIVTYTQGLYMDRRRSEEEGARYLSMWWTCYTLARVYKDHPDYDPNWTV